MSNKIMNAISHLSLILPLQENYVSLGVEQRKIYQAILKSFYLYGRVESINELIEINPEAEEIISNLAEKDMVIVDEQGILTGAYPFTMEPRQYLIEINGHTLYAMCALDALAPSTMFECKATIRSECAMTKEPVLIQLNGEEILNCDDVHHILFGINWQAANKAISCAESLCTEMLFLKGSDVAMKWQADNSENREVFNLPDAIQFAAKFFVPLVK
jgi:mercuric reductase